MIKLLTKIFKKPESSKPNLEQENVNVKTAKKTKDSDFLNPTIILPSKDNVAVGYSMMDNPEILKTRTRKRKSELDLKNSIVVKIFHEYNHPDFEYIGKSIIDGMPMYVFIGDVNTFKYHDIIFEELW
jgi:hypothetical protein